MEIIMRSLRVLYLLASLALVAQLCSSSNNNQAANSTIQANATSLIPNQNHATANYTQVVFKDRKGNGIGGGTGGGGGGGDGSFAWGWGGGGGGGSGQGGGGGGGWGWGGGGAGWSRWGPCGQGRGWRQRGGGRGEYRLGEYAECTGEGRCQGVRLDCPLHCGGSCFYDCLFMCKPHCRR